VGQARARLRIRYALQKEADFYREGSILTKVPDDEPILVYLVELDGSGGDPPAELDAPSLRKTERRQGIAFVWKPQPKQKLFSA
jgi:hypothetical protein